MKFVEHSNEKLHWFAPSLDKAAHLSAGADVSVGVFIHKDVYPRFDHGSLQGRPAHPLPQDVSEASLLIRLQHAQIILFNTNTKHFKHFPEPIHQKSTTSLAIRHSPSVPFNRGTFVFFCNFYIGSKN